MIRSAVAVVVLLMSLLSLAGCGGGSTTTAPAATAQIALNVSTLSFGSVTVGQTSASQTVTLNNTGSATATLSGITLSDTTDFALMNGCAATLAPAASCTLTLSFKPQSAASLSSTLTITSSAANSPQTIAMTGTGTTAPVAQAVLSPTSLTFAATLPGATAAAQVVTLTNPGTAALTISSVAIGVGPPGAFAQTNNCGTTLAAGASCAIAVTFTPTTAGTAYTATLVVTDSAASTNTVALSGSGSSATPVPQAVLSPASLSFASTAVGSSAAAQSITLSNPGNATLTGIAISIAGSSSFSETTTCGATLAAGGSCNIAIGFAPTAPTTQIATLVVSDNAAGLTQTASLSGTGTPAPAPVATLSAASITFGNTTLSTTSAAQSVTLTNSGNAALTITGITLGGANPADFAETTTCGTSLAAGASCTISATFSPAAASTYTGTITIADNAAGSPQTIALTGSGLAKSTGGATLYAFPETDLSVTPLYTLINNAQKTIDMTMYELVDTTFQADLVAACNRGVKVRVILDQSLEKSSNTPAYTQLNAVTNCSAAWSNPAFQATHEKSFIIDGTTLAIMSLNLTSRYYNTTRDFAFIESDPGDIAAVQTTFNTDYGSTTDYSYTPPTGTDLIWSPTTAQSSLLGVINGATKTLLVENEEMSATNIVSALEAACARGVVVHIAMTDTGSYHANFSALEAAGCGVHTYPDNATALYIHAKALVADYGLSTQNVYMGSINFSTASMTENRELGLYITDPASVQALYTAMTSDYAGASPY
ncbi:choice-of-anchor D domain-containing protein [Granulicella rosea]|uniref:choice-of-anchor D domain-containing protein n=1 Tax=Granulicella rosea TaxID=474952 RepID=UPI001595DB20|nr:choice-of-anchor D domain-containing protein [Granulicella rosea]